MDWRNIARPVIIIALAVCLVLFGVYKVKETYTGFMRNTRAPTVPAAERRSRLPYLRIHLSRRQHLYLKMRGL